MLTQYEAVVVFDPDLDNAAVTAQVDKIAAIVAQHAGNIDKKDFWGRKQLAYPIKKKSYGVYVVLVFSGDNTLIAELKRQLRINDQVLRFLVVLKDKFAPDFKRDRDEGERSGERFRHSEQFEGANPEG